MEKFSDSNIGYIKFMSSLISKCQSEDQIEHCKRNINYYYENNTESKDRDEIKQLLMLKINEKIKKITSWTK